jgi:hypothetical protein
MGKDLVKSFLEGSYDDISLAHTYLELVQTTLGDDINKFSLNDAGVRLAFDDPNIFGVFYNSFASGINRNAIRRSYSGIGAVLNPSQDVVTLYDVPTVNQNGIIRLETKKFDDLIYADISGNIQLYLD